MQDQVFQVVIPGSPALQMTQNGEYCECDIVNPGSIGNICFFLIAEIPQDMACVLYYSVPPYQGVEYLCAVANNRPSEIVPTLFPLNPAVNTLQNIKLIVKPEPIQTASYLAEIQHNQDPQKEYAKKVAMNLYNYMSSFDKQIISQPGGPDQEFLIVPTDIFERWFGKFERLYAIDRNYILKSE